MAVPLTKNPDKRVEIFIAPVNTIEDKSPEDGGDSDFVIATTEGFYALRHFGGSVEGRRDAANLKHHLSLMWSGAIAGNADKTAIDHRFSFGKVGKQGLVLKFGLFAPEFEYAEGGRLDTTNSRIFRSKILPVGEETVNMAIDASREKARELKMPDAESAMQSVETISTADSVLKRLENL